MKQHVSIYRAVKEWPEIAAWVNEDKPKLWAVVATLLCYDMVGNRDTNGFSEAKARHYKRLAWTWGCRYLELNSIFKEICPRAEYRRFKRIPFGDSTTRRLATFERFLPGELNTRWELLFFGTQVAFDVKIADRDKILRNPKYHYNQQFNKRLLDDLPLQYFTAFRWKEPVNDNLNINFFTIPTLNEALSELQRQVVEKYDYKDEASYHEQKQKANKDEVNRRLITKLNELHRSLTVSYAPFIKDFNECIRKLEEIRERLHSDAENTIQKIQNDMQEDNGERVEYDPQIARDARIQHNTAQRLKEQIESARERYQTNDQDYRVEILAIQGRMAEYHEEKGREIQAILKEYRNIADIITKPLLIEEYHFLDKRDRYYVTPLCHTMEMQWVKEREVLNAVNKDPENLRLCGGDGYLSSSSSSDSGSDTDSESVTGKKRPRAIEPTDTEIPPGVNNLKKIRDEDIPKPGDTKVKFLTVKINIPDSDVPIILPIRITTSKGQYKIKLLDTTLKHPEFKGKFEQLDFNFEDGNIPVILPIIMTSDGKLKIPTNESDMAKQERFEPGFETISIPLTALIEKQKMKAEGKPVKLDFEISNIPRPGDTEVKFLRVKIKDTPIILPIKLKKTRGKWNLELLDTLPHQNEFDGDFEHVEFDFEGNTTPLILPMIETREGKIIIPTKETEMPKQKKYEGEIETYKFPLQLLIESQKIKDKGKPIKLPLETVKPTHPFFEKPPLTGVKIPKEKLLLPAENKPKGPIGMPLPEKGDAEQQPFKKKFEGVELKFTDDEKKELTQDVVIVFEIRIAPSGNVISANFVAESLVDFKTRGPNNPGVIYAKVTDLKKNFVFLASPPSLIALQLDEFYTNTEAINEDGKFGYVPSIETFIKELNEKNSRWSQFKEEVQANTFIMLKSYPYKLKQFNESALRESEI